MLKQMISFAAVVGLVLALAPSAQAEAMNLTLSNAAGPGLGGTEVPYDPGIYGTPEWLFGTAGPAGIVIDDPFAYDPDDPTSTSPDQTEGSYGPGYATNVWPEPEWSVDVATGGLPLDFVDVWGRQGPEAWDDPPGTPPPWLAERTQNLIFEFWIGAGMTGTILDTSDPWNGLADTYAPGTPLDDRGYARFDVSTVLANEADRISVQSFRIFKNDPMHPEDGDPPWEEDDGRMVLYEVRAASSVPEPSTFALAALGLLGLLACGWRRR